MPQVDPEKSFDVAVRHMFRHLSDAVALRTNPLVRSAFEPPGIGRRFSDHTALTKIQSWILSAGRTCYTDDIAAGLKPRAERQFSIICALVSGVPIAETAAQLGVSIPQAYRDRRVICTRVARLLVKRATRTNGPYVYDPLHIELSRASSLADHGYAVRATADLERILSSVSSKYGKVRTLLELGAASIEIGDLNRSEGFVVAAKRLLCEDSKTQNNPNTLCKFATLVDFRLAIAQGKFHEAAQINRILSREFAGDFPSHDGSGELWITFYLDQAFFHGHMGNFEAAVHSVKRATQLKHQIANVRPSLHAQIGFMTAYSLEGHSIASIERLLRYEESLALSVNMGSARYVLLTMLGLANHWASLGNDDQTKSYADQALQVAESIEGTESLLTARVDSAYALLKTKHWRAAERLLTDADRVARPGTLNWSVLKALQGDVLARRRDYSEAVAALNRAESSARELRNDSHRAGVLRDLAIALNGAGHLDRAKDCISEAIRLAEQGTSASGLLLTQRAASQILRDELRRTLAKQA